MAGETEWRVRTPLDELAMTLDCSAGRAAPAVVQAREALLLDLLVLVEHGQADASSALSELEQALGGRLDAQVVQPPPERHALGERLRPALRAAVRAGWLTLERRQIRKEGPIDAIPEVDLPANRASSGADSQFTFIAVKVVDQDGTPIGDEPVQIELPDGTVVQGRTDKNGELMLDELRDGGQAKIRLPNVKQPGQAQPVDLEHFVEIELLDEDGDPVPGVPYSLRDAGGTVHTGVLDAHGTAFISPVPDGECTVNFVDLPPDPATGARAPGDLGDQELDVAANELVLHLVDQDGFAVADRDFVVTFANGDERTGKTDTDGVARVPDAPAEGNAQISFPSFDESDFAFVPALPGKSA